MDRTCSECDSETVATMKQQPFCEKHGQEKLEELQSKKEVAEAEFEAVKKEYERLKEKYDVESYGEIEYLLNVEESSDITESAVDAVNDAEKKFSAKRQELQGINEKIKSLQQDL